MTKAQPIAEQAYGSEALHYGVYCFHKAEAVEEAANALCEPSKT
jgi:hypothetical protein